MPMLNVKGSDMMTKLKDTLLECQKNFLLNSKYEPTEWNVNQKTFMYTCNKNRVNICYDIPNNLYSYLDIDDVINIHKKMFDEMVNVCQKCKYYNQ